MNRGKMIPITGFWLSIAACFMLFVYSPLEIYFLNKEEFWFDIFTLFPIMFSVFVVCLLISILLLTIAYRINKNIYMALEGAYFVAYICTYIQGNFLVKSLPPLDGTEIDWGSYSTERLKCIALWIIVIILIFFIYKYVGQVKFHHLVTGLCVFVTMMLFLTLLIESVLYKGFERKPQLSITTANEFEMSSNNNFIILVLDSVKGETLSQLMQNDDKYYKVFEDFTYYDNTMGGYPYTKNSVPLILSGKWYENDGKFKNFVSDSLEESPLLSYCQSNSYEMGIYETGLPLNTSHMERFNNLISSKGKVTSYVDFAIWQFMMTGYKYAPFDLKRFCFIYPVSFNDLKKLPDGYETWSSSNTAFYNSVLEKEITLTEDNVFKFIHIEGAHPPMKYNENVEIIENGTYEQNVKASLTIADAYLGKLKSAGVYDNSIIVIMADHGYDDGVNYGRQNPFLCIKGINEKHEMKISNAPISFDDLQNGYRELLKGKLSDAIFNVKENEDRERRYLWYTTDKQDCMIEYVQTGQAWDMNTLCPTGREYVWEGNEKNLDINQVGIHMK